MDERVPKSGTSQLNEPEAAFSGINAASVGEMMLKACDVCLVLNEDSTILDVSYNTDTVFEGWAESWIDQPLKDLVTIESVEKIDLLLNDAGDNVSGKWRQVNHTSADFGDVPVTYAAHALKPSNRILFMGRDLSSSAQEQKRFMNAQLSMERAYSRIQTSELRYRQIFQNAGEAVLIIDCANMKVMEANATASRLFGAASNKLQGRKLKDLLSASGLDASDALMQAALGGRVLKSLEVGGDRNHHVNVSAMLLREDKKPILLLRLTPTLPDDAEINLPEARATIEATRHMPDGFVVIRHDGTIVFANQALSEFLQVLNPEDLCEDQFSRWFDRMGVDFNVLISNLKEHGSVKRFATALRGAAGIVEQVEIAGVEIKDGDTLLFGLVVRPVSSAERPSPVEDGLLPYSAEQLTSLVGHMSLKDVVKETTSVIERLCIEAALELTGDNRASAAQLLGLSRQSLYDKLAKTGLSE